MIVRLVRDFGGLRFTTVDWPLFVMEIPEHRLKDEDLVNGLAYFEEVMRECQRGRERFAIVTDLAHMHELPPSSQRKIAGDWVRRTSELQQATSLGGANVTPSAIIRGIVTAIYWFQKPLTPSVYFATRTEATLQAIRWIEEARVTLPPHLVEMRKRAQALLDQEKRPLLLRAGRR